MASELTFQFLALVDKLLIKEKRDSFMNMFTFPVPINAFVEEIFKKIERVFDGVNPVEEFEFTSDRDSEDHNVYRNNELKLRQWWKEKGREAMMSDHNSIVVVDLPREQEGSRPAPYPFFLSLDDILKGSAENGTDFEWLAYRPNKTTIIFYDDEYYRVFEVEENSLDVQEPIVEVAHNLGYCPVRTFWTTSVNKDDAFIKRHVLSNFAFALEMILFYMISNEELNIYARFPVSSSIDQNCNFENREKGHSCKGGFLALRSGAYVFEGGKPAPCPVCSNKRFNGAGSHVSQPPLSPMAEKLDTRDPFVFSVIPKDSLDYNNEDTYARMQKIFKAVTGFEALPLGEQAVNVKQVLAVMDSLEAALKWPQQNLEKIISWTDKTIAKLRYTSFQDCSLSMGTEHFIASAPEMIEVYELARKSSFPADALDLLQKKYFDTEYRNNPELKRRRTLVSHLDPFKHRTVEQVIELHKANIVLFEDMMLKLNLSSLLQRFESEMFPITAFDEDVPMANKVAVIKAKLLEYIEEMKPEPLPEPEPKPNPFNS